MYLYGTAVAASAYFGWKWLEKQAVVQAAKPTRRVTDELSLRGLKLNHRERRFIKFASAEYQGQLYMTPQDFIESVTDSEPRPRLKRRRIFEKDLERFAQETPILAKGSPDMFRNIFDKGIISYTEYLFLLSILTKPQTGFRIAFNMFDTDGNERVDKEEFLVLMEMITAGVFRAYASWVSDTSKSDSMDSKKLKSLQDTRQVVSELLVGQSPNNVRVGLEKIFSTARRDRLNRALEGAVKSSDTGDDVEVLEDELQKSHVVDTTLLLHFFGRKGKQDLKFEEFQMFMENLQTEVLEIEFNEFSKGLPAITELDFAKILLRYTYLQSDQYEMYLERLLDRIPEGKGITFSEFKSFCQFLNTLDDFAIAMRMYTLADQPISQEEFHRAVKICTGAELSPHIVDTVFKIFDDDGDGQLSYKEFIAIMRDRLHRGFKHTSRSEGWDAFKQCVKSEMKAVV
ncbi:calcium uptake protein 3, mitochondrial-like isoform X1 [Homarus americanus]|uniref:calcium uptake protein 3, mitochondrial-like isoform X1 n=1 Tax=Homarus americanus TaxID=6706 RepID=UPI001C461CD7|nr:calcium uptake protein 3, mitochondrial-like isoform X1 [Homarus americanus]XP_042221261.1 calcium uptake protein 3, mitochondrial-like isoform X1 [Homarus americanus]XP_042221262.1 calcium uptake protein 3, mitochondrial-like isoform X1 [Homarus americanus]